MVFAAAAGPSESALTRGIFRSAGGIVSAVALEGDPAPNFGGETFESFGDPNCVSFSSSNRVGFSADVVFPGLAPHQRVLPLCRRIRRARRAAG